MDNEYFASINEVSKQLDVPAHTLRYWEKQFPVAIRPTTGTGGRRYYRTETVRRLTVIKQLLYTHGMTIAGVKKLLRDGNLPDNADELVKTMYTPDSGVQGAAPEIKNISKNMSVADAGKIDLVIETLTAARELLQ